MFKNDKKDKKGKCFGLKWGPSSVPVNLLNLMPKL